MLSVTASKLHADSSYGVARTVGGASRQNYMPFKSDYYSGKSHGAPSFEYKTSLKTPKNRVDDDFDILFEKEHLHW